MSILPRTLKATGIYDKLKDHFLNSMLLPFATVGQISIQESRFLGEITRSLPSNRPIIEIGTLFGSSARVIAQNKKDDQELLTVDAFTWNPCGLTQQQHKHITERVLAEAVQNGNVRVLHMDKTEFYETYGGLKPAMIFIDADHSYEATRDDIQWALSRGVDLICGHDYANNMPGVVRAVDESGGVKNLVDTLWVLRRDR
jgi:hypothetical protein